MKNKYLPTAIGLYINYIIHGMGVIIISQKSAMPDKILRRYLLSPTSLAAASVRLLLFTTPLSTLI